eukprot:CAMPEP_0184291994 /NCGR_PEP_ID=MMETSP1049-20130417/3852_1 /TAXON_ID=77928 /ORGANISM="Proteomonas sulcata, Strain CCMP704" /LENGTH=229 /DNA_ID=CAMNT_0026599595 /DNA_START=633 /DNA_END=1322 /DNA_ORIENTATION=+
MTLLKNVAPVVGVFTSTAIGFGPLTAVLKARKNRSLGDINPDPFPVLFGNAIGWIIYAAATRNIYIYGGNVVNVMMGIWYLMTAYGLTTSEGLRRKMEILTVLFTGLWTVLGFYCAMIDDEAFRINLLGIVCNVIVIILFASPLTTAIKVIQTKNSVSISRPFAAIQLVNCGLWTGYGLAVGDYYVWVPNTIAFVLGVIQAVLICVYPVPPSAATLEEPFMSDNDDRSA